MNQNQYADTVVHKQEQRTFLRERFLRLLTSVQNSQAQFTLVNGNTISAAFGSSDVDILQFQVSDLRTPLGTQPDAILRTTDISSFTVQVPGPSENN